MLMGATFAWFTDNVSSTGNRIQAGDLEVDLVMYDGSEYVSIGGDDGDIFSQAAGGNGINWEPGKTEIVYLGVKNNGSLALKYNILLNIKDGGLVGSLEYAIIDGAEAGDITETDWASLKTRTDAQTGDIQAGLIPAAQDGVLDEIIKAEDPRNVADGDREVNYFALAVHMKEEATNEFENQSVVIDLVVSATQKNAEKDSFGPDYDIDADVESFPVSSAADLAIAIASGATSITLTDDIGIDAPIDVTSDITVNGNGSVLDRADGYTGTIFNVSNGAKLTLVDIVLDGGAIWEEASTYSLARTNTGVTSTAALIVAGADSDIVLGPDTIIQNNDGSYAVHLGTRIGATLTLNGAQIINNNNNGGAIWGGGHITINEGSKISYNTSSGIAGAIRMVGNCNLTMNGGEISYNTAAGDGGAIWGYGVNGNTSVYKFNGGEIAHNTSGGEGGAIYFGTYSEMYISGDVEIHDNTAASSGAFRLTNYTIFNMTGGKIYDNTSENNSNNDCFYGWCPRVSITGGELSDNITIDGGHTPTVGGDGITGTVNFMVSTNHNTVNLAKDFGTIKFTVAEGNNFANFNFKPAADYTYAEGDEAKLICLNEGYKTYWDETTSTFRLTNA